MKKVSKVFAAPLFSATLGLSTPVFAQGGGSDNTFTTTASDDGDDDSGKIGLAGLLGLLGLLGLKRKDNDNHRRS